MVHVFDQDPPTPGFCGTCPPLDKLEHIQIYERMCCKMVSLLFCSRFLVKILTSRSATWAPTSGKFIQKFRFSIHQILIFAPDLSSVKSVKRNQDFGTLQHSASEGGRSEHEFLSPKTSPL